MARTLSRRVVDIVRALRSVHAGMPTPLAPGSSTPPRFTAAAVLIGASVLLALDAWAMASVDSDFYLPDVFRPFTAALVVAFVASGWARPRFVRTGLRALAATLAVAVLILEAQARFGEIHNDHIMVTRDVLQRYQYRPDARVEVDRDGSDVRINSQGLWDREHAIPKPPGVYRVVLLTGSIANDGGVPYSDRFHEVLERRLAGALPDGRRIEVINVSCEGYNTQQQVRLLERVGLRYEPDLVVVGYMLTSASLQNGAYRRIGNSFFLFRFLPLFKRAATGSVCSLFEPFHRGYGFELVVRGALERLALLRRQHGFRVLVAVLPVVEDFADPLCNDLYDRVARVSRATGFETIRVVDAFRGERFERYLKPNGRWDVCHPNVAGHRRIAGALDEAIRRVIARPGGSEQ